jgi:hypothetical protein
MGSATGPSVGSLGETRKIIMEITRTARDTPVLVNRAEAQALCGSPRQFNRLVRTKRLENCVLVGGRELYRSAQCLAVVGQRSAACG